MNGQTEIKLGLGKDAVTYGVLFNNQSIAEAEVSFGVDLRTFNFLKSPTEMIILIYCGIVSFCAKYRQVPIKWDDFYELVENNAIDKEQVIPIVKAFQESTVMTTFIKSVADALEKYNNSQSTEKKKKAIQSLKKGKLPSTKD